ncbi:tetratricopeptide repeat protein [Paractinoplanes rishiriensis]|uniref:Tetratricopeptide repeat protein n=1 Tax=Paractinoplanes rishiriensis TaxID=1050105 RepID=A0A919K849_9ACTN|nr:tetratricopeptide repeat protein [Actinoplanes rishiriensis]GIF00445.1 hypothetical protein Ari01nite_79090 [Actinoplanes rishiriensis]
MTDSPEPAGRWAARLRGWQARWLVALTALAVLTGTIGLQADLLSLWPNRPCWLRAESELTAPYNIVVANPAVAGRAGHNLAREIRHTLERQIATAVEPDGALVQVGAPCRAGVSAAGGDRAAELDRARRSQNGDIAVSFVLYPRTHHTGVRLEFSIGGPRLREAAELAGYTVFDELDIGNLDGGTASRDLLSTAAEQAGTHVRLLRAVAQYSSDQYPAAARTLTALLDESLGRLTRRLVLVLLGNAHGRLAAGRDFAAAERYYRAALRVDPGYPRARLGLAEIAYQAGATDCRRLAPAARRALTDAYREYETVGAGPVSADLPDLEARARAGLGRVATCRLLSGDRRWLAAALEHLRFVVGRYEANPAHHWLRTPASEAYGQLGAIHAYVLGNRPGAGACYRRAAEIAFADRSRLFRTMAHESPGDDAAC